MLEPCNVFEGIVWGAGGTLTILTLLTKVSPPFKKWWRNRFIEPDSIQNERLDALEEQISEIKKCLDDICNQNMATLHNDIYRECVYHLTRGFVSKEALNNLTYLYEPYHLSGGNGLCEKLMYRVLELPIGESFEDSVQSVKSEDILT